VERGGQVGEARLEGLVVDDRGAPVPGARVSIGRASIGSEPRDLPAVTTDEAGRFAVDGLAPETVRIDARRDELYLEGARVRVRAGRAPVVLRMRRGMTLTVRVVADGAPLAGAQIERGGDAIAVTGPDGAAEVRGVTAFFDHLTVRAEGRGAGSLAISGGSDPGGRLERTVVLAPGAPLGGTVVDADGHAVAGATVLVVEALVSATAEATSDASGRWRAGLLAAGTYRVQARAPGRARGPWNEVVLDGAAPAADVVVALGRGGRIRGEVVDERGAAVAGALCEANGGDDGDEELVARTDADGVFELTGVPAGSYEVLARTELRASRVEEIDVEEDEVATVRLVVEPSEVAGRVLRPDGSPVRGAEVGVRDDPRYGDVTDRDGQFELGALPPGRHVVEVAEDGRAAGSRRTRAGDTEVVIRCQAPATLTGRVLLAGQPMTWFAMLVAPCSRFSFVGEATGFHAEDGRFAFPVPQPGDLDVVLAGPGTARRSLTARVVPGQMVDLGDIELERGRTIRGRVVDADGRPAAGAIVTIGGDSEELDPIQRWFRCVFETITDADGRYVVEGVDPQRADGARRTPIAARLAGLGAAIAIELPDDDAIPDLVLAPVGGIDGEVGVAIESAVSTMSVLARRRGAAADVRFSRVAALGRFRFDDVPAGDYDLELVAPNGASGRAGAVVAVVAGERVRVTIALPAVT
jgi:protocatechuate 3,4-dioxygenase beta subunit